MCEVTGWLLPRAALERNHHPGYRVALFDPAPCRVLGQAER